MQFRSGRVNDRFAQPYRPIKPIGNSPRVPRSNIYLFQYFAEFPCQEFVSKLRALDLTNRRLWNMILFYWDDIISNNSKCCHNGLANCTNQFNDRTSWHIRAEEHSQLVSI